MKNIIQLSYRVNPKGVTVGEVNKDSHHNPYEPIGLLGSVCSPNIQTLGLKKVQEISSTPCELSRGVMLSFSTRRNRACKR